MCLSLWFTYLWLQVSVDDVEFVEMLEGEDDLGGVEARLLDAERVVPGRV